MPPNTLRGSLVALTAAASLLLLPFTQATKVLSRIDAVPPGWMVAKQTVNGIAKRSASYLDDTHVFTVALARQNMDQLESHLFSVSDPKSPKYGAHIDAATAATRYGPSHASVAAVQAWLDRAKKQGHVQSYAVSGAYVDVVANVAGANALFNASYQYYHTTTSSSAKRASRSSLAPVIKLRTLSYAVPDDVADHVTLVDPGNYFGRVRRHAPAKPVLIGKLQGYTKAIAAQNDARDTDAPSKTQVAPSCATSITPSCLKQMYSIGDYKPDSQSGSAVGFASFLNQSAQYSDLFQFETMFGLPFQNFSVELINNGTNWQNGSDIDGFGEANLDVQNIVGIAQPLPVTEWITGGSPPFIPTINQPTAADNQNEPYVPFFRYLSDKNDLPQVVSNSYGDQEDSVPLNYAIETCNLIGLLGLRGVSVLFSSGDGGVGAGCLAPDYKTVEFDSSFPASCPYVTAVGGTIGVNPEIAWPGSSGGFSRYFSRPGYQKTAIDTYLDTQVSPATRGYYGQYTDFSGRGFPDIAAHSATPWYVTVLGGKPEGNGGTSAAAPATAAIIALLNDARFRAKPALPALGFLNLWLYQNGAQVLNDITSGHSVGCNGINYQSGSAEPNGSGIVPGAFWNATEGWDPVTGLGTPNFAAMNKVSLLR